MLRARRLGAMRGTLALTAFLSAAAASAGHANASCTYNSVATPSGVFALTGDICTAAAGTYKPTVQPDVSLPVTYTGFGFFAYSGGVINSSAAVTIDTSGAMGAFGNRQAYGAWSDGTGAQINFSGPTTISTTGAVSFGLFASQGGAISLSNGGSVTTSGAGSAGLFAALPGSTITATGVGVTTNGGFDPSTGSFAAGVEAVYGGSVNFSGGSITTNGPSAFAVVSASAIPGAVTSVTLSGTTESPLTILTNGNGSIGLAVNGPDASLTATDVRITTHGNIDNSSGIPIPAFGAYNGAGPGGPAGGTMTLTNTTIITTGIGADGVVAASGGVTTINGGSVTTNGANSIGVYATGAGSSVTTTNLEGIGPVTIATTGADSPGVQADTGGAVTLNGGTVTASGIGSFGLWADGAGSTVAASGVAVTTNGGFDPDTGRYANALLATNGGSATFSGGSITTNGASAAAVASLGPGSNITLSGGTTVLTTGDGSSGLVVHGAGASLTATGVSVATQGNIDSSSGFAAFGVVNGSGSGFSTGGTMTLTDVTIATTGQGADGVFANSGGVTTLSGGSVSTSGANALGLYATGAGSSIATSNGTTIATSGSDAHGVLADTGGSVTLTNSSILTTGTQALGVYTADGGTTKLTGDAISTSGDGSTGIEVTGAGSTLTASGISVSTLGSGTLSVGQHGVETDNGGTTSLLGGSVTTSGASSSGVLTDNAGSSTTIAGTTVTTNGDGSSGVTLHGTGSFLTVSDAVITTHGAVDPATGYKAIGVYNGNNPSGSILGGGVASLTDTSILTTGDNAIGVATENGGLTKILGGSISTSGFLADAILSDSGGTTIVGVSSVGQTTITTAGNDSPVVVAESGGFISLAGAKISATGAMGSSGLVVHDAGSELDASNVTVTTQGAADPATGRGSYGLFNGPFGSSVAGGVAKIMDSSISTQGPLMYGVYTSTGGATTLNGTNVSTAGIGAVGLLSDNGGVTNVSGGSVATTGQDAHALEVTGAGSLASLGGINTFSTLANGSIGLYAASGGVISSTGLTLITTAGGVSTATGLGAYGVNADGAGSQIRLGPAMITTSGAGAFGLLASDAAGSGAAGSIAATEMLNVRTTNAAAAAVGLQGNGASILATGGGTIVSAGNAIAFLGGTNQTATFDFFTIDNQSGDLIFADPSVSTVNFFATIADAGTNNLLDSTAGSVVTLNAYASTLTGAIQTAPGATSNVNLTDGTTWNLTGPSTVTNLSVTNSVVVFAPPSSGQAFKTLTVTNYVGAGALITLNTSLGGSNSASDQIIVNGGKATGTTYLTIRNVGGLGAQTTGAGIPVIIATNGGTITSGAFDLANTPAVGGFKYSLEETNGSWYLVSSPSTTRAQVQNSVNTVAKAQQNQIVTNRVLGSILLGATEQISCSSCASGFGSIGSFALGAHGRLGLSDQLTAMGGISYNQWTSNGISVYDAPTVAGSLVYDFSNWGSSRPFIEAGGGLTPYEQVKYSRNYPYPNGYATALGTATAVDRDLSLFARLGWLARLTPIDEAAVYGDLSRNWMQTGGYSEATTAINPYPETVAPGLDTLNVARIGGQYTHLFNGNIEVNVSGGVAYGFGAESGTFVDVYGYGPIAPNALPNTTWVEYGARVGYRFNERLVIDAFVIGTAFGEVGTTVHGGVALRYAF